MLTLLYALISALAFYPIERLFGFNRYTVIAALTWPLWLPLVVIAWAAWYFGREL